MFYLEEVQFSSVISECLMQLNLSSITSQTISLCHSNFLYVRKARLSYMVSSCEFFSVILPATFLIRVEFMMKQTFLYPVEFGNLFTYIHMDIYLHIFIS